MRVLVCPMCDERFDEPALAETIHCPTCEELVVIDGRMRVPIPGRERYKGKATAKDWLILGLLGAGIAGGCGGFVLCYGAGLMG